MKDRAPAAESRTGSDSAARGLLIGALIFFVGCCAFGALEVNPSNDTWIGLAAGREISALGRVPATDHFSYTANGQPWLNQNWLAHWLMFRLYQDVGPGALLVATWLTSLLLFASIAWAAWRRSGSLTGSLLVAGLAALGCRDFLAPRPATVGLACVALSAALLSDLAFAGTRRQRVMRSAALGAALLFWGNAHGTFVFGYAMCAVFAVLGLASRRYRPARNVVVALAVSAVGSALLLAVLGPFGPSNFWHPSKVATSDLWRLVPEWRSPLFAGSDYGRIARFWGLLAIAGAAFAVALFSYVTRANSAGAPDHRSSAAGTEVGGLAVLFRFDVVMCLVGLVLALWARRFIPMFYIFAAPAILCWVRPAAAKLLARTRWKRLVACMGVVGGLAAAVAAWSIIRIETQRMPSLLDRFVRADVHTDEAFRFLRKNELTANIVVEWSESGPLLFHAPLCRVFIDGRAQQVYDERQFVQSLVLFSPGPLADKFRILNDSHTDAVLLRPYAYTRPLWSALEQSDLWVPALIVPGQYGLFLRGGSAPLRQLAARLQRGEEWRPDLPAALLGRGWVWMTAEPPGPSEAVMCWQEAVQREMRLGLLTYSWIAKAMHEAGRDREARAYFEDQLNRLIQSAGGLNAADVRSLQQLLERLSRERAQG